jgi:hypothetical protein
MIRPRNKRLTLRIQIPIYAYKIFNQPGNLSKREELESPLVGWITMSSEQTEDYWAVRNAYLTCEKPSFETL